MDQDLVIREKIEWQIKNSYGKVCYSFTCHEKEIQRLIKYEKWLKISQIILSAISAGTLINTLFGTNKYSAAIGSIFATALLIINSMNFKFDIGTTISKHKIISNKLWLVREKYLCLISELKMLDIKEIINRRDNLMLELSEIYSSAPKTSKKSYKETQKALKYEEENFFTEEEINLLLPPKFRNQ